MKVLYYDCFAGISGDMNLAAMIDLGVSADYLKTELLKLNLDGYSIQVSRKIKKGITGTQVNVITTDDATNTQEFTPFKSHQNIFSPLRTDTMSHTHIHRTFKDIKKIILESTLNERVKTISYKIFERLAIAEGKVHGQDKEEVHFHEVGAIDSIIDIVGAAICLDFLKVDHVACSTISLGSGFAKCAHGTIPIPAPATVEILKGIPVKIGTIPFEATTPTGAAILATLADEFTDRYEYRIEKTAYGLGHKDGEIPNVLRVHLGMKETKLIERNDLQILECNIDDMNPEWYEYATEKLFANGALDVFITPIIMKKGRPASKFSVLTSTADMPNLSYILLEETTTLGIRSYPVSRVELKRKTVNVETSFGFVNVKLGYLNEINLKLKPEYEDCKALALKNGIPIQRIYEEVNKKLKELDYRNIIAV
jgi:pyridinium-3,5-bisthiocarboxylic acid mononucleotide nickel chelatase